MDKNCFCPLVDQAFVKEVPALPWGLLSDWASALLCNGAILRGQNLPGFRKVTFTGWVDQSDSAGLIVSSPVQEIDLSFYLSCEVNWGKTPERIKFWNWNFAGWNKGHTLFCRVVNSTPEHSVRRIIHEQVGSDCATAAWKRRQEVCRTWVVVGHLFSHARAFLEHFSPPATRLTIMKRTTVILTCYASWDERFLGWDCLQLRLLHVLWNLMKFCHVLRYILRFASQSAKGLHGINPKTVRMTTNSS